MTISIRPSYRARNVRINNAASIKQRSEIFFAADLDNAANHSSELQLLLVVRMSEATCGAAKKPRISLTLIRATFLHNEYTLVAA